MSIASQLQDYKYGLMDAYDAVSNRGGTMPARCNMDSLATAINSIPSGGGSGGNIDTVYRSYLNNTLCRIDNSSSTDSMYFKDTSVREVALAGYAGVFGYPYNEGLDQQYGIRNTILNTVTLGDPEHPMTVSGNYAFAGAFSCCSALNEVTIIASQFTGNNLFYGAFAGGALQNDPQSSWPAIKIYFKKLNGIWGQKTFLCMFGPRSFYQSIEIHFPDLAIQPSDYNTFLNMFQGAQAAQGIKIYCKYSMQSYFNSMTSSMGGYNIQVIGYYN